MVHVVHAYFHLLYIYYGHQSIHDMLHLYFYVESRVHDGWVIVCYYYQMNENVNCGYDGHENVDDVDSHQRNVNVNCVYVHVRDDDRGNEI